MMGHKSITVTQQYARKTTEYIQEQLEYAELGLENKNLNVSSFTNLLTEHTLINLKLEK